MGVRSLHGSLVLQNPSPSRLTDAEQNERLGLGGIERKFDGILGRLRRREPQAAVRRKHGEGVAFCEQHVRQDVCDRRRDMFEQRVVGGAAAASTCARRAAAARRL